jgi:hypothetical protein
MPSGGEKPPCGKEVGSSNHEKNDTEEEAPPAADGSSIMQPVVKEATPLMPCCWICSKTDEDPSVLCHNCDNNGGHAHIKCIVNQARAKNETDYCNYKVDTTIMDDTKSLEKEYNSLKSMLEEPWLKCGRCSENYRGSTEKLLADEFFEYYKNRGGRDIRTCFAVFAVITADCSDLGKSNKWSEQPYNKIQRFKQVVECNQAGTEEVSQTKEVKLFTQFKLQIENEITKFLHIAEFCLPPKKTPKPPEAACWICLDDEPDEHGGIDRTCACRGGGGYCHLKCIANFAVQKDVTFMQRLTQNVMAGVAISRDDASKEVPVPWTQCPTCNQKYTGEFAFKLAGIFAMQYYDYPYNELRRQVSIDTLLMVCYENSRYDVGINAAMKQINLIRTMQKELYTDGKIISRAWIDGGVPDTQEIKQQLRDDDAKYCTYLVGFYKATGQTKLANDVLREMKAMGVDALCSDEPGVDVSLQFSIDDMLNNVHISPDKSVKWRKAEIERLTKEFGKDSPMILDHKFALSNDLLEEKKLMEGLVLLFEVVGDATRILGPEHPKTVEYSKYTTMVSQALSMLSSGTKSPHSSQVVHPNTKAHLVSDIPALNGKEVNAVKYTKDKQKLIVDFLEPIPNKPSRVKIPPDQLVFDLQTIVTTPDNEFGMITGFDTETKNYSVMPFRKMAVKKYKQIELVIVFQPFDTQKGTFIYP